MTVTVEKWEDSLMIPLPAEIARSLSIENGSRIHIRIEDDVLVLVPHRNQELTELIEKITPDNLHAEVKM